MPPVSGRSRTASASARARILRAAARLYATQGFEGTSVREIAAAAGVTKPLVSYHFGSKEQLFSTLLQESLAEFHGVLRRVLEQESKPEARLYAVLATHLGKAREAPEIIAFAFEALTMPGMLPLGHDFRAEGRRLFESYVDLIADGQARGAFRSGDARAAAVMTVGTVAMYAMAVLCEDLPEIPPGTEDAVFDLLMRGVQARREPGATDRTPRRSSAVRRSPAARRGRRSAQHKTR